MRANHEGCDPAVTALKLYQLIDVLGGKRESVSLIAGLYGFRRLPKATPCHCIQRLKLSFLNSVMLCIFRPSRFQARLTSNHKLLGRRLPTAGQQDILSNSHNQGTMPGDMLKCQSLTFRFLSSNIRF